MDGERTLTTQADLEEHILSFYKQFYTRDDLVEEAAEAREDCLQNMTRSITEEHNLDLIRPITMEEVSEVVKQLPEGKTPGTDSISA